MRQPPRSAAVGLDEETPPGPRVEFRRDQHPTRRTKARQPITTVRNQRVARTPGPVVIGWGRKDRITFPSQAERATRLFPDARRHWFEHCGHCGHFPHWDDPEATVRLILDSTA